MSAGLGPKSNNSASRGGARERAEGGTTDVGPASGRARRHRTTRPRLVRALAHGLLVVQGRQCPLAWLPGPISAGSARIRSDTAGRHRSETVTGGVRRM